MERLAGHNGKTRKKIRPTIREASGSVFMLRCAELGLSDEALANMSLGMVYDLMTERENDSYEYPYKAQKGDLKAFFGGKV